MPFWIVPIVEGKGEVEAIRVLIDRVIAELNRQVDIKTARPIPRPRDSLVKDGGIEAAVNLAADKMGSLSVILVLMDSEGECPGELGPALSVRAQSARPDKSTFVVLAHQEFEAWFLASASSLKGQRGLSEEIEDHHNPESVRGCKEWLEKWMPRARKYSETADQAAFTARFDMTLARQRSPSFGKLWSKIERICKDARAAVEKA